MFQYLQEKKKQQIEAVRQEIKAEYQAFLETQGRLPEGFSLPYNTAHALRIPPAGNAL